MAKHLQFRLKSVVKLLRKIILRLDYISLVHLLALVAKDRGYVHIIIERECRVGEHGVMLDAGTITPNENGYSFTDYRNNVVVDLHQE